MYLIVTKNFNLIQNARENGDRVIDLGTNDEFNTENMFPNEKYSQRLIFDILSRLGVPQHIKGFNYLKFILETHLENPDFINLGITKKIYPTIAKKFNTNISGAERDIRTAINIAFERGDFELQNEIFGFTLKHNSCKPTNSEFIHSICYFLDRKIG